MKKISVVTPCFNEEGNVEEIYKQVKAVFSELPTYTYEHIFIDNASQDRTVTILKELARQDRRVKIIVNTRNFGSIRSHFHAFLQARGDAVVIIVADLQEPPALIKDFIAKWEEGYEVVIGVKKPVRENILLYAFRQLFYRIMASLSEIEQIRNFTGFGLYDQRVVEIMRSFNDPYPYFRGLITEIGFEAARVEFVQPPRASGRSKINLYNMYEVAIAGIINHSKIPLRLAIMLGSLVAFSSLLVALGYFIYKLIFWNSFNIGTAPLVIGLFFFSAVQLFCIGIIGEYIGSIHTQVLKRPLVIEQERINF